MWRIMGVMAVILGGCAGTWGTGLGEQPSELPTTTNAVVVVLGDDGFTVAGARLTGVLSEEYPGAVALDGVRPGTQLPISTGFPDWVASWLGDTLPASISVDASVAGPTLSVELETLSLDATLEQPGAITCNGTVSGSSLKLTTRLVLKGTKSGQLEVSLLDEAQWDAGPVVDFGTCLDGVGGDPTQLDELLAGLATAIAADVLAALAPGLETALPSALGVGLGTRVEMVMADPGLGEGSAVFELIAPEGVGDKPWSFSEGQLYLFFTAGTGGARHPCVPADDNNPPTAPSLPVPQVNAGQTTTLMLSEAALLRSLHLTWLAGRLCGDRATAEVELPLEEAVAAWPELGALGETTLSARAWPQAAFEAAIDESAEGDPELTVSTAAVRVEVYASVDDARVLVTAFTLGMTVSGPLQVSDTGEVWLDSTAISVTSATEVGEGILAPPANIAATLGEPLAVAVLNHSPVWQLPDLPVAQTNVDISRLEGYLVFSWPTPTVP